MAVLKSSHGNGELRGHDYTQLLPTKLLGTILQPSKRGGWRGLKSAASHPELAAFTSITP